MTEFGFLVMDVEESDRDRKFEGRVEFELSTIFVTVSGEQRSIGAIVGRINDVARNHAASLRYGKSELVCVGGAPAIRGNWFFSINIDYLERLKEEYGLKSYAKPFAT